MALPRRWVDGGLPGFAGRVRFRRPFQWVHSLAYYERLWLVIGAADYFASVTLNGEALGRHAGAFDPFEFDITRLVRPRNELVIDVDCPALSADTVAGAGPSRGNLGLGGGLWGTVALEVRRESFLRGLEIAHEWAGELPVLHLRAQAWAETDRRLGVDVRLDGRSVHFAEVGAGPSGTTFTARAELCDADRWWPSRLGHPRLYEVAAELIDTASSLDVRTRVTGFREIALADEPGRLLVNGKLAEANGGWTLGEPIEEAASLDEADQEGRLLVLADKALAGYSTSEGPGDSNCRAVNLLPRLLHHPSLAVVSSWPV
jgi:beta-galactosidase/beta-glucuronidase